MRILIVYSCNTSGGSSQYTFIKDQADALSSLGIIINFFGIKGKGVFGYLSNFNSLLQNIKEFKPDIIHAHYGLSGLLANLQRRIPVITTYHGSDINNAKVLPFSRLSMILSAHNIFVSEKSRKKAGFKFKNSLIPCGVDINLFNYKDMHHSRKTLGFEIEKKLVLFAGAFSNSVKNSTLAKDAVALLPNVQLVELTGYSREQVAMLMNIVDVALMTSFSEGSPMFIKEALACNCPIVSVPVGDVTELIDNIEGCYISTYNSNDVAEKLKKAMNFNKRTNGHDRILALGMDNKIVAKSIFNIYSKILKKDIE